MDFCESQTIELKEIVTDGIKKEIIAFANGDGGSLYIGVNDTGAVVGVEEPDRTIQQVSNMVRSSIKPDLTMFVDYEVIEQNGKMIIAVTVQRGTDRPYYLANKGLRPQGVYVRQGTSSVPASDTAIRRMIKETDGDSFEIMRSLEQELTFEESGREFQRRSVAFGEAQRQTLKLQTPEGIYTNLGLLLSEQCTHTIKVAVFEGTNQNVFKDRREFEGSLLKQMNDVYDYIDMHNYTRSTFNKLRRIDSRDYPEAAVREALLNSLVHRDYGFSASTLISIYTDRMEFVSIGGLLPGISLDDVMVGLSVCRNPQLANVFYRLELIEAYGTGMRKILSAYEGCEKTPHIETTDNAFKITLPNLNAHTEIKAAAAHAGIEGGMSMNVQENVAYSSFAQGAYYEETPKIRRRKSRESLIMDFIHENGDIMRRDAEQLLGISQTSAGRILKKMVDANLLVKEGNGKNTKYYSANES